MRFTTVAILALLSSIECVHSIGPSIIFFNFLILTIFNDEPLNINHVSLTPIKYYLSLAL